MLLLVIAVLCVVGGSLVHCNNENLVWNETGWNIPGGRFEITNAEELQKLKTKYTASLAQLSENNDKNAKFEFLEIISANYRITTGTIYDAYANLKENNATTKCFLSLWEKNWINFTKFDVSCGEEEPKRNYQLVVGQEKRKRRQTPGGFSDLSSDELNTVRATLDASLVQLNRKQNVHLTVVRLISAQKQIVSGIKYHISAELSSPADSKICTIDIWEQPWIDFRETDITCADVSYHV